MTVEICSCEGLNPECEKCFGSGYAPAATPKKSATKQADKKTPVKKPAAKQTDNTTLSKTILYKKQKLESYLPKKMESLTKQEVEEIAIKIIATLDVKSKKQMQLLNSIPFNTSTFRRDFKDKFENLTILEVEKQHLRNELLVIDQQIVSKKYNCQFKFKHFLSDKDLDVTSNRQLKDLIREYKKLMN